MRYSPFVDSPDAFVVPSTDSDDCVIFDAFSVVVGGVVGTGDKYQGHTQRITLK